MSNEPARLRLRDGPTHAVVGWNETASLVFVTLHDDGAAVRSLLPLAKALSREAPVIALAGARPPPRGRRFLYADPGATASWAVERDGLTTVSRDLLAMLNARRARLREAVAIGAGGGADALAGLLRQGSPLFAAAVLLHPSRRWEGPSPPADLRGLEVLLLASAAAASIASHVGDLIRDRGGEVFMQLSPKYGDVRDRAVAGWISGRLCGDADND